MRETVSIFLDRKNLQESGGEDATFSLYRKKRRSENARNTGLSLRQERPYGPAHSRDIGKLLTIQDQSCPRANFASI